MIKSDEHYNFLCGPVRIDHDKARVFAKFCTQGRLSVGQAQSS
jgi:hypothetical protein